MKSLIPENKTKIICTIGPACNSVKILCEMIEAGMNIARLNFSHGSYSTHRQAIENIRTAAKKTKKLIGILQDLPGPKIRVGKLSSEPIILENGKTLILTTQKILGNQKKVSINISSLPRGLTKNKNIFLNDGFIRLKILKIRHNEIESLIERGGELRSHKGVNFPGVELSLTAFTLQDRMHLDFGLSQGIQLVSLSFVQGASDILRAKKYAKKSGKKLFLIAKIERERSLKNIDEIIPVADGIMIARGDLGVEIPIEQIPWVQKELIKKCNQKGNPVITATQMLESMVSLPIPTRAEATDVANAVFDGTDAVMLSEETAVGKYPIEAVETLAKILGFAEKNSPFNHLSFSKDAKNAQEAFCRSAYDLAIGTQAKYLIISTETGTTPKIFSKFKPKIWVLAFTQKLNLAYQLLFYFGVFPLLINRKFFSYTEEKIAKFLLEKKIIRKKDNLISAQIQSPGSKKRFSQIKLFRLEKRFFSR
jgi:pyruvate kinase